MLPDVEMTLADDDNEDQCEMCGNGGELLCCDGCPAAFHLYCLEPKMKTIPKDDWYCPQCVARQERQAAIQRNLGKVSTKEKKSRKNECGYCQRRLCDMSKATAARGTLDTAGLEFCAKCRWLPHAHTLYYLLSLFVCCLTLCALALLCLLLCSYICRCRS